MDFKEAPNTDRLESVAALRELYRSSEARAARLRLLIEASRDLADANAESLDGVLQQSARRAAHFAGFATGFITQDTEVCGQPLTAPGPTQSRVGTLVLGDGEDMKARLDTEDSAAFGLLCQLIATTIERVKRDEERDRLLTTLQDRERRLEHVVGQLFRAQEDERRRVSAELHDGVAQTAGALFRRLELQCADPAQANNNQELASIAQGLVRELRRVISGLRPTALDDLGLASAISGLAETMRSEGFEVDFRVKGPKDWSPLLATAFFRIAQEALNNVRKHAGGPCKVEIDLTTTPETGAVSLRVRDFGQGLSGAKSSDGSGQHIGIEVMAERMAAIGGALSVRNHAGGGVVVLASIKRPI